MKLSVQNKRYLFIIAGILLFLPPIAIVPRFFGAMSMCSAPMCMRMLFSIKSFVAMSNLLYMGLIMLIAILLISFFAGRYWCSYLCPFGGITEIISKIVPQKIKINYSWIPSPAVRYGYFAAALMLPAFGIGNICGTFCNVTVISNLFGSTTNSAYLIMIQTFSGLVNLGMIILLGFIAVGGRAYCNFLCPIGAADAIINWLGSKVKFFKRIRIDENKCTNCGLCIKECPVWAIEKKENNTTKINQISCIPCKICMEKCPEKAISFQKD
ncbi:MAG: 4Fe-4S binding protein [Bacteroidales bacterium]